MRLLIIFLIFATGCSEKKKELMILKGHTMGTYYQIRFYDYPKNQRYINHEIEKELAQLNQEFSTYINDSLISQINDGKIINVSKHTRFKGLLEESLQISKETEGYFDITVGSLVNLWGFDQPRRMNAKKPTGREIKQIKKAVGYKLLTLKDDVILKPAPMKLDMSANAKGFAVDELSRFLIGKGYRSHFIEIGGETKAIGRKGLKKKKTFWMVGVEGPAAELGSSIVEVMALKNMAIATSGNYRNFIKHGDEVFGHTLNPKSGYPIKNKQISVTVLDGLCSRADAYATALMAMPLKKAMALVEDKKMMTLIIFRDGKKMVKHYSTQMKKYLGKE